MAKTKQTRRDPDLLAKLIRDIGLAGRLLFDRRVSTTAKMIPAALLLYMLSPLDLVPDFLLPFGIVDDLGAFLIGLQLFIQSAPREVLNEYRGVQMPGERVAPGTPDEKVAPGTKKARRGKVGPKDKPLVLEGQYEVREDKRE